MNAESVVTSLQGKFDNKINNIARHVLKESASDFKRDGKFSDTNLLKLYNIFGGVFERALELYESNRVTRIFVTEPGQTAITEGKNSSRWLLQIQGQSGETYMIYPEINFCPCPAFRYQVLGEFGDLTCKHVLAGWLASVDTQKLTAKSITPAQFRRLSLYQEAIFMASELGLRVTVENSKCMQGSCYIPSEVFEEFSLKEDVRFKINLMILVECLGMFWNNISSQGTNVPLKLFYKGMGHPVSVLIVEDGAITDCSLKTQHPDELIDFHLDPEAVVNKVVIQTELLKDFLNEIDPTSDIMELHLSPESPYFRISTQGLGGLCHIDLPHDSDLVEYFNCKESSTFGYKFAHIQPAMKALSCATKVSLRMDEHGLLSFQYMIKSDEGTLCYVEYYISPVIDDD